MEKVAVERELKSCHVFIGQWPPERVQPADKYDGCTAGRVGRECKSQECPKAAAAVPRRTQDVSMIPSLATADTESLNQTD